MSKPKIYELWHGDYDGNSSWQFTHPNNKLKTEFEQDCQDVLREFSPTYIKNFKSWIGTLGLLRVIADNLKTRGYVPFDETFETIGFGMGGSCIIEKKDEQHGENEDILKLLGDELKEKVYQKNEEIELTIA